MLSREGREARSTAWSKTIRMGVSAGTPVELLAGLSEMICGGALKQPVARRAPTATIVA
jgi:hypothetical protein